jgi:hypothetical protein
LRRRSASGCLGTLNNCGRKPGLKMAADPTSVRLMPGMGMSRSGGGSSCGGGGADGQQPIADQFLRRINHSKRQQPPEAALDETGLLRAVFSLLFIAATVRQRGSHLP